MNSKQSKKLRKLIRQEFKKGLSGEFKDATVQYCNDLLKELEERTQERDVLAEIIKTMQDQKQEEFKKEYEDIPQVLK